MAVCAASVADLEAAGARDLLAASLPKGLQAASSPAGAQARLQPGRANGVADAAEGAGQPAAAALLDAHNPNPPASEAGAEAAEEVGAQAAAAAQGAFAAALLARPGVARAARRHLRALLQGTRHAPFLQAGLRQSQCLKTAKTGDQHDFWARCACSSYQVWSGTALISATWALSRCGNHRMQAHTCHVACMQRGARRVRSCGVPWPQCGRYQCAA